LASEPQTGQPIEEEKNGELTPDIPTERDIAQRIAKLMALECFRNTYLEELTGADTRVP
jgi:hypothetical protein